MLAVVLTRFVDLVTEVLGGLILVRVVVNWVVRDPMSNGLVRMVYDLTDPVLEPVKRIFPANGLDLSPMIALILLQLFNYAAHYLIFTLL